MKLATKSPEDTMPEEFARTSVRTARVPAFLELFGLQPGFLINVNTTLRKHGQHRPVL